MTRSIGGVIGSAFFDTEKTKYFKNATLAKPTPKMVYRATLKSLSTTIHDIFVEFSHDYTKKAKSVFLKGDHILTHTGSLISTAAVALSLCNAYHIHDAAELMIANISSLNYIMRISYKKFKNPDAADKRIRLVEAFVENLCDTNDIYSPSEAFKRAIILSGDGKTYVSPLYIKEQQDKRKKKRKRNSNNNYQTNHGNKSFQNNSNHINFNNNNKNNNNNNTNTEPITKHPDQFTPSTIASKKVKPKLHMCPGNGCTVKGCSNKN